MDTLLEHLESGRTILADGAMGTMLQKFGLPPGHAPEEWNVSHPEVVQGILESYREAGARVLTVNSFGGNRIRLARHGLDARVAELNRAAAQLGRRAAGAARGEVLVAGDMGPTGEMVQPLGDRTPEELSAAFAEQAQALEEGGVDLFLIETMAALEEVRAAVEGIRSVSELPIAVTMTFEKRGRTMMGVRPEQAVAALEEMGVRFIGANCGSGPAEMEPVMQKMVDARQADTYLIASANAGLPKLGDDGHQHYDATPEVMAAYAARMREMGVNWVGACCGSTPEHIAAMREALGG